MGGDPAVLSGTGSYPSSSIIYQTFDPRILAVTNLVNIEVVYHSGYCDCGEFPAIFAVFDALVTRRIGLYIFWVHPGWERDRE